MRALVTITSAGCDEASAANAAETISSSAVVTIARARFVRLGAAGEDARRTAAETAALQCDCGTCAVQSGGLGRFLVSIFCAQNVGGVLTHNSQVSLRPGFFQCCG